MGIPEPLDPDNGPALPDMAYLPIGTLAARLPELLRQADGLPMPWVVHVDEPAQLLSLEFGQDKQSITDIVAWSCRFGGLLESHPCPVFRDPVHHVTYTFEFGGANVLAFAFIPANGTPEDDLNDNRF